MTDIFSVLTFTDTDNQYFKKCRYIGSTHMPSLVRVSQALSKIKSPIGGICVCVCNQGAYAGSASTWLIYMMVDL